MLEIVNLAMALVTVVLGGFGFLAPRYTMGVLDLAPAGSNMGLSEMRASVGGLFVAMGLGCLALGAPAAYAMLGLAYAGAAAGRLVSLLADAPPRTKAAGYFAVEAALAAWLLGANLPALTGG